MPSPRVDTPLARVRADLSPKKRKGELADKRGLELATDPDKVRSYPATANYEEAAKISPDKPLTERQRRFAEAWAAGESITSAQARAGYSGVIGYRLIRMPNILRVYNEEKARLEAASEWNRKLVMERFSEAYDMGKLICDPHAMISATREAAKMLGYYEPIKRRVDITITGNGRSRDLAVMSNEELTKLLDETPGDMVTDLRDVIEDAVVRDEESSDEDH